MAILAAILVAISNRPCKLAAILWRFRGDLKIQIAEKSPLFRTCSNLAAISWRFLHGKLPKRCLGGPLKGNLSRLSFLSIGFPRSNPLFNPYFPFPSAFSLAARKQNIADTQTRSSYFNRLRFHIFVVFIYKKSITSMYAWTNRCTKLLL